MYKHIKPADELASFTIVFDGACLKEESGTFGYSHLIEHLVAGKLKDHENKFNEYGITYNAATSNNRIFYYIEGLDKGVCKFKKLLIDVVRNGLEDLTEDKLEAEKKIVIDELSLELLSPLNAHLEYLGRKKFGFPSPAGIEEDIRNATVESVQNFAANTVQRKPQAIIDISSSEYVFPNDLKAEWMLEDSEYNDTNTFWFGKKKKVTTEDFCTSYWGSNSSIVASFKVGYTEMPFMQLAACVLGDGLSSPLYDEIRNKRNLAYGVHTFVYTIAKNFGIFIVAITVNKNKEKEAVNTLEQILSNPTKYVKLARFKSICKAVESQDKINHIRIVDNPLVTINKVNSVGELVRSNVHDKAFLEKTFKVFNKVVKNVNKNITVYNGNKKYEQAACPQPPHQI